MKNISNKTRLYCVPTTASDLLNIRIVYHYARFLRQDLLVYRVQLMGVR